ncbi:hypothetical protein Glove_86g134 [Diversispora epigaea]|uniref:Protein kinase domain-containing protein n=1 Tax=Diversispora epigaea TaxID=1348612 RepID=A0A397JA94_9GLOM|nr:hypothetical protein Glove_86g134 [Diversispora epigaea]
MSSNKDKEKRNIPQDDAGFEKEASTSNSESAKNALGVLGVVGDAVHPYLPLFSIVTTIITEINNIYANAKYNKNICNSLMDRVNVAEFSIKSLERRKNENEKKFRDPVYFRAFHRFIEVIKNIKQFIANVSTLSGFQKYFHAKSVKEKFESLIIEFESAMNDLHFVTSLHNEKQRRIDHESLDSDLKEMAKFLSTIGGNVIDTNQQVNIVLTEIMILKDQMVSPKPNTTPITANEIDPKDLKDPLVGKPDDRRGPTVVRKMLSNGDDVACKTKQIIGTEVQKIKAHLAILGKLKESKNILKFYGLSKVEDQDVMVFEWADFGSLQEVYREYDIGWRSKIQMALDICRGLVFLQTCDILHHDIRCSNIMMTKQLVPKLSNFKYARHNSQATTDIKEITNILRWMAPEKMKDPKNVRYTFKFEDQDVMVFEWADFGSLQEVYREYDIGWRSKIQMALDICRGLVFLQTCDILHHDIRCSNIMMTKQLVPKLSNFKYARHNSQATTDIKEITNILRWMAPEKMKDPKNVRYTFKCEIFSFGMLLWELLFQKIPYENKDMNQIKDHVLKGGRETIIMNFSSQENRKIQNKFFKIIISAWQQDINIRASLLDIFLKLQKLAANYPIDTSPTLNPLGSLYLSPIIESAFIGKSTELPDSFQNFTLPTIIPLEEGIEAHKNKDYQKAWSCFNENVKFNSTVAKYWMGYYLSEGLPDGKKDLVKANLLFKEAADDGIADAQLHYAFSLLNTLSKPIPGIKFDRKVFVSYLTMAANGGNIAAQYNLGDMYFNGKILGIKDAELGIKFLKLAALNNDSRSIKILKDNKIDLHFGHKLEESKTGQNLVDNINKFSSEVIYQTDYFSVKATIMLGTTATAKLEKLLLEQKDAIDNILRSQPVHAVGPNFQQGYSIPCITCYVSKPLEAQVLKNLSSLFDHEFVIEEQMMEPIDEDTDNNHSDRSNRNTSISNGTTTNDLSDGDVEMGDANVNGNGDVADSNGNNDENVNGGDGNSSENSNENGNGFNGSNNGNSNADGDGGGGGGGSGNGKENVDEFMKVSSEARVIYKNHKNEFQNFNINAKLWANVSRDNEISPPANTLEFKVNLSSCGVGKMLNEICQKLNNYTGYFLDSVEIGVSPLSYPPGDTSNMISFLKEPYMPRVHFTSVDHSVDYEKNVGLNINVGQDLGATAVYNARNNKSIKATTDDWLLERSGCFTTGVQWLYRFTAQKLYKDGENQRNLPSTGIHSGHWYIKDNMKGFSITIKQVLNCKIKSNNFSLLSLVKCPKLVHTLEITFNNLEKFNKGFAELRKKLHCGSLNPEIKLEKSKDLYFVESKEEAQNIFMTTGLKRKLEESETGQNSKKKKQIM